VVLHEVVDEEVTTATASAAEQDPAVSIVEKADEVLSNQPVDAN
jgi:hypothetical protein